MASLNKEHEGVFLALQVVMATFAQLGTKVLSVAICPRCLLVQFADADTEQFVCSYCGEGPWQPGEGQSVLLHLSEPPQVPALPMSGPGATERTGA